MVVLAYRPNPRHSTKRQQLESTTTHQNNHNIALHIGDPIVEPLPGLDKRPQQDERSAAYASVVVLRVPTSSPRPQPW
jgi:hypothetical protein